MLRDQTGKASASRFFFPRGLLAAPLFAFALGASAAAQDSEQTTAAFDPVIVGATATGSAAAFVTIVTSSIIRDNVVIDIDNVSRTQLTNSLWGNQGIVQVNQDAGIASNQQNVVAIAIGAGTGTIPVGVGIFNQALNLNNTVTTGNVNRSNVIENILDGSVGIAQINQNSGTLNRNLNALGIAIGLSTGSAVIINEASLAAAASGVQYNVDGPYQASSRISGITNFTGIAQIAQSAGDGNVVSNSLAIGVTVVNR